MPGGPGVHILPCTLRAHVLDQTLRRKIFHFNFSIQLCIYWYLETKPMIVFQGLFCVGVSLWLSSPTFNGYA